MSTRLGNGSSRLGILSMLRNILPINPSLWLRNEKQTTPELSHLSESITSWHIP